MNRLFIALVALMVAAPCLAQEPTPESLQQAIKKAEIAQKIMTLDKMLKSLNDHMEWMSVDIQCGTSLLECRTSDGQIIEVSREFVTDFTRKVRADLVKQMQSVP